MSKQTAVEWLEEKLKENLKHIVLNGDYVLMESIFLQAKAMEKEQIMMAVKDSWYMAKGSNFQEPQEEQYYNKTYKGGEQ